MIKEIKGNLLKEQIDVIVHQANLFCSFGGGIAWQIRRLFPEAEAADNATKRGDQTKLGTFSTAVVERDFGRQLIVNIYSQLDVEGEMVTSYDYLYKGLVSLRDKLVQPHPENTSFKPFQSVGFPKGMGCGIATGSWAIVEAIIKDVFQDSNLDIFIVKYAD